MRYNRFHMTALHSPTRATLLTHHVPQEWADKYKGRFDGGWDTLSEETFERQKRLGRAGLPA